MLIITRRAGERIMVGDNIVDSRSRLEIVGNSVRNGDPAPRASVPVYRKGDLRGRARRESRCGRRRRSIGLLSSSRPATLTEAASHRQDPVGASPWRPPTGTVPRVGTPGSIREGVTGFEQQGARAWPISGRAALHTGRSRRRGRRRPAQARTRSPGCCSSGSSDVGVQRQTGWAPAPAAGAVQLRRSRACRQHGHARPRARARGRLGDRRDRRGRRGGRGRGRGSQHRRHGRDYAGIEDEEPGRLRGRAAAAESGEGSAEGLEQADAELEAAAEEPLVGASDFGGSIDDAIDDAAHPYSGERLEAPSEPCAAEPNPSPGRDHGRACAARRRTRAAHAARRRTRA